MSQESGISGEPENEPMNNPKSIEQDSWLKGVDGTNRYSKVISNNTGSLSARRLYQNESISNTKYSKLSPKKNGMGQDIESDSQSFQSFLDPGSMTNS